MSGGGAERCTGSRNPPLATVACPACPACPVQSEHGRPVGEDVHQGAWALYQKNGGVACVRHGGKRRNRCRVESLVGVRTRPGCWRVEHAPFVCGLARRALWCASTQCCCGPHILSLLHRARSLCIRQLPSWIFGPDHTLDRSVFFAPRKADLISTS